MNAISQGLRPKKHPIRIILFQALVCFFLSTLGTSAGNFAFEVTRQNFYLYTLNLAYFGTIPAQHFTVKDFTRTNEKLGKKYGAGYSNGRDSGVVSHLDAFVVPVLSDDQYSIRIVSDHSLSSSKLQAVAEFAERSMVTQQ
jgi:hypothetical protein